MGVINAIELGSGDSEPPQVQSCPECKVEIDISEQEPLELIHCPGCEAAFRVHGRVDRFRLIQKVGSGRLGAVYRAIDTVLNRPVALKLLSEGHSANQPYIANFTHEAATLAEITHRNVIRVFSTGYCGKSDTGRFFIAMEFADKGSLADLLKKCGKLPEADVLELGIQIARGLAATDQRGLIHRDVKPANILFAETGCAKITDSGLGLFLEEAQTGPGDLWETPSYVAPERLENEPEDFRTDVYSLGCTLYHALAGHPPFEAAIGNMAALTELKGRPTSVQAVAPWVSSATATIIDRAMRKDPGERQQSYEALIQEFEFAREQLMNPVAEPEAHRSGIASKDWGKSKSGMIFVALVALVAVAGIAFSLRPEPSVQSVAAPLEPLGPAALAEKDHAQTAHKAAPAVAAPATVDRVAPWTVENIGARASDGNFIWDEAREFFTISGMSSDIWYKEDSCQFVSQSVAGDFEIRFRVLSIDPTDPFSKVGVMLRSSNQPAAANFYTRFSFSGRVAVQLRPIDGEDTQSLASGNTHGTLPIWLKLTRLGATVSGALCRDGQNWTNLGSAEMPPTSSDRVGIAFSAKHRDLKGSTTVDRLEFHQLPRQ